MLEPVGTAPGLVVPPAEGRDGPTVVVLPGPPRELQPMWRAAEARPRPSARRSPGATSTARRCCACSASRSPRSPRRCASRAREGVDLDALEITTCLRRGEVEVVTRFEPPRRAGLRRASRPSCASATPTRCSPTTARPSTSRSPRCCCSTAAGRSPPRSRAPAGCWPARLTERAGSSDYVLGGLVVYADEAKVALAGVDPALIGPTARCRPRSPRRSPTAPARRSAPTSASGSPASPGPGGGTEDKPVGTVCFSVAGGRATA